MCSGPGWSSRTMRKPANSHDECADPLANGHRPLSFQPPSTGVASPLGISAPEAIGIRPSRNTRVMPASVTNAPINAMLVLLMNAHHPADELMYESSSISSRYINGSTSGPPSSLGTFSDSSPSRYSATTDDHSSVSVASLPSASASRTGRTRSIALSRCSGTKPPGPSAQNRRLPVQLQPHHLPRCPEKWHVFSGRPRRVMCSWTRLVVPH